MRIGLFSNAYHPFISGVVNCIDNIRDGLLRLDHHPYIFAPEVNQYQEQHSGVFRFPSVELTKKVKFPIPIPFSAKLWSIIPRLNLDIIHTHHPMLIGDVGAHFSRRLDLPLVYTFHTQLEQYAHYVPLSQTLVKKLARNTIQNYASKCDLILCPSPIIKELLLEYGIQTPLQLLPNAIDVDRFAQGDPQKASLPPTFDPQKHQILAYIGRIGIEKSLDTLLRCFAKVHQEKRDTRLLLVGDGPSLKELQQLSQELGIHDKIHFTGSIDYQQVPHYLKLADFFVTMSTSEVKPLSVLEALSASLPVVAVEACGLSDTISSGQDGWLSEPEPKAYQKQLLQALNMDSESYQKMRDNAYQTARKYDLDNHITQLLECYEIAKEEHKKRPKPLFNIARSFEKIKRFQIPFKAQEGQVK